LGVVEAVMTSRVATVALAIVAIVAVIVIAILAIGGLPTAAIVAIVTVVVVVVAAAAGMISRRTGALSGLSSEQRKAVLRAVRRGEAPSDASLAAAVVSHSQRTRKFLELATVPPWLWWAVFGFSCAALLIEVGQALSGTSGFKDVLEAAWLPALFPCSRWVSRRSTERASRAEAAAVRLMGPGAG